ncbi:MAG: Branched-chain amino acid transport system / permease component [Firmicutes bacterium ADurb.Bin153]|nr:MAG: Branched-chain amino acid transport system / permease component [Firmicutes bacterium ADurb.Bin153]
MIKMENEETIQQKTRFDIAAALREFGVARIIILAFLLLLFVLALAKGLDVPGLITDSLVRVGMNGVLILAMLPSVVCGVGMNFGLPLGILAGLLGGILSINMNIAGWAGFFVALAIAVPIAIVVGVLYHMVLDKVRGQEMMVGTYLAYAAVFGMCICWMLFPIKNPKLIFAVGGKGLRYTISLTDTFGKVLNNFLKFRIGGITVPTGLILFWFLLCLLMYLFLRSKTGLAMKATGSNPVYAMSSGVNVAGMKRVGVVLSTVLGAVGIIAFAQSYGFLQLYNAPQTAAFPAIAAILIGGASLRKASVANVIIGAFLFQTLLTVALPVTQAMLESTEISEIARVLISNGMILYALTRATGGR